MHLKSLLFVILIAVLAGCGSDAGTPTPLPPVSTTSPAPSPTATATPNPATLQLWTVLPDRGISEQNINALAQAFQQEYPAISIQISSQPTYTDLYRKVVASIAAGTLPDIVTGTDADILQYARLRALSTLDDFIADPAVGLSKSDLEDIPAGMRATMQLADQDNRIYSLPFARGALALYYNWGAMKAIGITNTPRSWDEFRLHARTLTKNPVRGFAYHLDAVNFDALLMSRGGNLFSSDLSKATFNSSAAVDALSYLSDGVKEGWIYRAEGNADMSDFATGRTIFTIASTTAIPNYRDAIADAVKKGGKDFEWGITLLPQADAKGSGALLVGSNIAMLRGSNAKQQAAWLFMRWLMRPANSAAWTQVAGVLPTRLSAREQLAPLFQKSPQQKQAIDDLLPVAHAEANVRAAFDIRDLIEGALAAVDGGKSAPKPALDDAAAKATILLNTRQ
jgi:ABC-type glycerol-3-phosphate transport system substrate-binding protein